MDYYINPTACLEGAFTVPSSVVDRYFKFSKAEHIKILLYILKNMTEIPDESVIAKACGVSDYEVKEALLYWADAGILLAKDTKVNTTEKEPRRTVKKDIKPTRSEILKLSMSDPKIKYLLDEAQKRLARNLKDNETRTLVWLYDDQGMEISIILLILQYAILKEKMNIRFIESVAMNLLDKGIDNIADADAELHRQDLGEKAWLAVSDIFGLERRKPSEKEKAAVILWLDEWKISKELLKAAYDECVNKKSKFSFPYVSKIIENWHKDGITSPDQIDSTQKNQKANYASYDIDLYEKMLNAKD